MVGLLMSRVLDESAMIIAALQNPENADLSAQEVREVINATRIWMEKAVIGLNLCPFAKAVHVKKQVRYAVSDAKTVKQLQRDFTNELRLLADTDASKVDTTLLIHPWVLTNFLDYNDFLDVADEAIQDADLDGEFQVASFHPEYQFAGTDADDIGNFTNRSPYPTLHLLREASIESAVAAFPEASEIYEKNITTMQSLGRAGWDALFKPEGNKNK
jgi:hypothetical protein